MWRPVPAALRCQDRRWWGRPPPDTRPWQRRLLLFAIRAVAVCCHSCTRAHTQPDLGCAAAAAIASPLLAVAAACRRRLAGGRGCCGAGCSCFRWPAALANWRRRLPARYLGCYCCGDGAPRSAVGLPLLWCCATLQPTTTLLQVEVGCILRMRHDRQHMLRLLPLLCLLCLPCLLPLARAGGAAVGGGGLVGWAVGRPLVLRWQLGLLNVPLWGTVGGGGASASGSSYAQRRGCNSKGDKG